VQFDLPHPDTAIQHGLRDHRVASVEPGAPIVPIPLKLDNLSRFRVPDRDEDFLDQQVCVKVGAQRVDQIG
jgi:hypothetical protein